MQNSESNIILYFSTFDDVMEGDVSDYQCQPGSVSPTATDLQELLNSDWDDYLKLNITNEEDIILTPMPETHSDHDYFCSPIDVPDICNEVTVLSGNEKGWSHVPLQDSFIGSTVNQEAFIEDWDVAMESDCSQSTSQCPSPSHSEKSSSSLGSTSTTKSKRGRPRKSPEALLKRLENPIDKEASKTIRNNASSMKYRHKKSDEKLTLMQQLANAEIENKILIEKNRQLDLDIKRLQSWLYS